jgi:hypothetical protein
MSAGSADPAPVRPIAIIGGTGPAGMGLGVRWESGRVRLHSRPLNSCLTK